MNTLTKCKKKYK